MNARRRANLRAALAAVLVRADASELRLVHRWLDSWSGIGVIVTGMSRQGCTVSSRLDLAAVGRTDAPGAHARGILLVSTRWHCSCCSRSKGLTRMLGFFVGALVGGIAGYYWRENIRRYMSDGVPDLRKRAADGLGILGDRASEALDRARSGIDTAVRTSQERLRPTATAGREPTATSRDTGHNPSGTIIPKYPPGTLE